MAARAGTKESDRGPPPHIEGGAGVAGGEPEAQLTEEEFREALYRRLMAQHRDHDAELDKIVAAAKARKKLRTTVRNQLKQAGFYLKNVDNILETGGKSSDRREEQSIVDQLHWMRELEGLPVAKTGEQLDLYNRLPVTEKDAIMWEEDGYHQGVVDNAKELPAACPPILHQRWLKKWDEGHERRLWGLAQEVNVERDPDRASQVGVPGPVTLDPEPGQDDAEAVCDGCGGDGSKLDADVTECPKCGAEYEPEEAADEAKTPERVH
jgi:hypothetical protein